MEIVLQTERLYLRRFTMADYKLLLLLNSDPEVIKYVHEAPLKNEADAEAVLRNIILPQYEQNLGRWAVHLKSSNDFIGWCGLKHIDVKNEIDLGYRFFKNCWGNGYATEAAAATLNFGHETLKLPLILGKAHIENLASLKVLEKLGMKFQVTTMEDDCHIKIYASHITDYIKRIVKEK